MGDKSPRHASIKKPSKTINQKRAAKKIKLELGCTNDLGQGLSTERICSCQSDAGSSARSSRLRRSSW